MQLPADGAGKKLRTRTETVGANSVHHEVIELANASETIINPATEDTLGSIKTAVELLDNVVSGSEAQVDVVAALPAGTNAIGKLAANTGVDIGDVDVTSVVPGVAAASLGKAEDAGHTTGDTGVPMWGVRNDTPTSLVNADLDYTPIAVDEYGQPKVHVVNQTSPISSTAWKHAAINCAGAGDNTLLAAQGAGNKIAVWSVLLVSDGTVDVRFEDGAGGTAMTGQIPLQEREGFSYSAGGMVPIWMTSANTLLNLELSAAVNVHGSFSYTVVT